MVHLNFGDAHHYWTRNPTKRMRGLNGLFFWLSTFRTYLTWRSWARKNRGVNGQRWTSLGVLLGERRPKIIVVSPGSSTNSPTFIGRPKCTDHYKTRVSGVCFPLGERCGDGNHEVYGDITMKKRPEWGYLHTATWEWVNQGLRWNTRPPIETLVSYSLFVSQTFYISYSLLTSLHVQSSCLILPHSDYTCLPFCWLNLFSFPESSHSSLNRWIPLFDASTAPLPLPGRDGLSGCWV